MATKREQKQRDNEYILLQTFVDSECVYIGDDEKFPRGNQFEKVSELLTIYQRWRSERLNDLSTFQRKQYLNKIKIGLFSQFLDELGHKTEKFTTGNGKNDIMSESAYNRFLKDQLFKDENKKESPEKRKEIRKNLTKAERTDLEVNYRLSTLMYGKIKAKNCFVNICDNDGKIDYNASRIESVNKYYELKIDDIIQSKLNVLKSVITDYKQCVKDLSPDDLSAMYQIPGTDIESKKYMIVTDNFHTFELYENEYLENVNEEGFAIEYLIDHFQMFENIEHLATITNICERIRLKLSGLRKGLKRAQAPYIATKRKKVNSPKSSLINLENQIPNVEIFGKCELPKELPINIEYSSGETPMNTSIDSLFSDTFHTIQWIFFGLSIGFTFAYFNEYFFW